VGVQHRVPAGLGLKLAHACTQKAKGQRPEAKRAQQVLWTHVVPSWGGRICKHRAGICIRWHMQVLQQAWLTGSSAKEHGLPMLHVRVNCNQESTIDIPVCCWCCVPAHAAAVCMQGRRVALSMCGVPSVRYVCSALTMAYAAWRMQS
jgi:hypothetical protein